MKALCDKITAYKCPKHNKSYCFINKRGGNNHESILCDQCLNPKNAAELINVQNALQFLEQQQTKWDSIVYQSQSRLWQGFQRCQQQIKIFLQSLEQSLEEFINSISGNQIFNKLKSEFLNYDLSIKDIVELGQLLSSYINLDSDGIYHLEQNIQIQQQSGFIQATRILQTLNITMKEYKSHLDSIQIAQVQNQIYHPQQIYETTQTINVCNTCRYVSLNTDETQMVAAVHKDIALFKFSRKGEWIQEKIIFNQHLGLVNQVKFNHDSTQIVSCCDRKLIIIWSKQAQGDWSMQQQVSCHRDSVQSICFNHDSTLLASGGKDNTIYIYIQMNSKWQMQQQLTQHTDCVSDVFFNHDSTLLASGSFDKSILLWKLDKNGKWIVMQQLISSSINRVSFNCDSTKLLSCSSDNTITIWSADKKQVWKCNYTLTGHTEQVTSAQFNKQSNTIVSSSMDKSIKIWKVNQQNIWQCTQTISLHKDIVQCAIINNNLTMIISGSVDKTIQIHRNKQL